MSDLPSLAIVIVGYNAEQELRVCLAAIAADSSVHPAVVVVDNCSHDGTAEMVRREWPAVRLIESPENVGFARANNAGIRATESEMVLLLNPDTVIRAGAIATLVRTLQARPEAAAAGPRLVDEGGRAELSFGWTLSPLGELRQKIVGALYHRRVGAVVRLVEGWTGREGPREWISGACLVVRRADLESVGLFDERFFLYTEDVDLCLALRRRGRAVLFVPAAEVVHLRGRSAARNPATARLRRASQIVFYEKHHPRWAPWLRAYLRLFRGLGR
ncbi:MAG: glycosyltransferase family 2 protein [Acidobacteriota bacterium]